MKTAEVVIESCAAGRGYGVAHAQNMTLFVPGTVPGDVVEISWKSPTGKRTWAIARTVRLVQSSLNRVVPFCPHACVQPEAVGESCGGCPWMAMTREEQVHWKIEMARHAFREIVLPNNIKIRVPKIDRGLRCRCRMNAAHGKLGFFATLSNQIIDVTACPMMQQPQAHEFLRSFLPRVVEIRQLQGQNAALHLTLDVPLQKGFEALSVVFPQLLGAHIGGVDFGKTGIIVDTPSVGPLTLSSAGFFQTGPEVNALILDAIDECVRQIPSPGLIVEGYAGAGNCTRVLLRYGDVIAVESDPFSCRFFNENIKLYQDTGGTVQLLPISMEQAITQIPANMRTVVLDPPRTGINAHVLQALVATAPDYVILIACDLASGARDACVWHDAGYQLKEWILIDSMPHTPHMEIVQLFMR